MDYRASWEAWAHRNYADPAVAEAAYKAAVAASSANPDSSHAAMLGHRAGVDAGGEYRCRPDRTGVALTLCMLLLLMFVPATLLGLASNPSLGGYLFLAGSVLVPGLAIAALLMVRRNSCFFVLPGVAGRRNWRGKVVASVVRSLITSMSLRSASWADVMVTGEAEDSTVRVTAGGAEIPTTGLYFWSDDHIREFIAVARPAAESQDYSIFPYFVSSQPREPQPELVPNPQPRTQTSPTAVASPTPNITGGQVLGWVGTVAALLIGYGVFGLITNTDAATYELATKPMVAATVVSTATGMESAPTHDVCYVTLDTETRRITVVTDQLAGACDDTSPLKPGAHVQLELWNGKATAIYDGSLSWSTEDNPGHNAALSNTTLFFGVLIGGLDVAVLVLWLLGRFVLRRVRHA